MWDQESEKSLPKMQKGQENIRQTGHQTMCLKLTVEKVVFCNHNMQLTWLRGCAHAESG